MINNLYCREIEKLIVDIDKKDIIVLDFATTVTPDKTNGKGRKINERKIVINPESLRKALFPNLISSKMLTAILWFLR